MGCATRHQRTRRGSSYSESYPVCSSGSHVLSHTLQPLSQQGLGRGEAMASSAPLKSSFLSLRPNRHLALPLLLALPSALSICLCTPSLPAFCSVMSSSAPSSDAAAASTRATPPPSNPSLVTELNPNGYKPSVETPFNSSFTLSRECA